MDVHQAPSNLTTTVKNFASWMIKGGLSLLDQAISSGSNFILNILLARWLGIHEYGFFALATAFLSLFYQVQNALVMEPMSVIGTATYPNEIHSYLKQQVKIHFWIFFPLGLLIAAGATVYGFFGGEAGVRNILITLGILAAFVQLPWLIRRGFYVLNKPGWAALYSVFYSVILIGLVFLVYYLKWLSAQFSFILMGAASLGALLCISPVFIGLSSAGGKCGASVVWNQNWNYGRWLLLTGFFITLSSQAPIYLSGIFIGPEASGVLKAMLNFIQPMAMSISAIVALALPVLSKSRGQGDQQTAQRYRKLLIFSLLFIAVLYELILIFFSAPIEQLIYDGRYAEFTHLIPLWGIVPILSVLATVFSIKLRVFQKPQGLLLVAIIWTVISLVTGILFINWWGVMGATISTLIGYAATVIVYYYLDRSIDFT